MRATRPHLIDTDFPAISRQQLQIAQINLGYLCNLSCVHCHVNAGPKRTELMSKKTINEILSFIEQSAIHSIDLTGGAPEMNPHFEYLVSTARGMGLEVIDRCNLVILQEPDYQHMAKFLAQQQVEIIASLPCYLEDNVDKQRGKGVFQSSLDALKKLNALGYGQEHSDLQLNLVYNPQGPELPPEQSSLQSAYKKHLKQHYGIVFNQLFVLTNMPIQRFGSTLLSKGLFDNYMHLLKSSYQPSNLDTLMCRNTISIDWQGFVYDCDFNQMLDLPLELNTHQQTHISQLNTASLNNKDIRTGEHCYGCTAGQGSSCGGALSE